MPETIIIKICAEPGKSNFAVNKRNYLVRTKKYFSYAAHVPVGGARRVFGIAWYGNVRNESESGKKANKKKKKNSRRITRANLITREKCAYFFRDFGRVTHRFCVGPRKNHRQLLSNGEFIPIERRNERPGLDAHVAGPYRRTLSVHDVVENTIFGVDFCRFFKPILRFAISFENRTP